MSFSKEFIAAAATPLILAILRQGDSYGYAIIQRVRELSGGEMEWSDGMLYPILHRLEKKGLIESYWQRAETGRRRKYYHLRTAGAAELNEHRQTWQLLQHMLQQLNEGTIHV